ncbi:MAG TPA: DUF3352 domain-containing protein [Solirubrobacteraceae bacterium]|nr:DUF3352 domain-containing protein [Solirubrobacteraceae bacterium]
MPRPLSLLAALLATALLAAGCGGGSAGNAAGDPARVVPAGAPVYAELLVHPQGALRANAEQVSAKLFGTANPGAQIVAMLDRAGAPRGLSYERDVKPWLGDHVGLAVTAFGKRPDGFVAAASKDDGAAGAAVSRLLPVKRSFDGTSYRASRDGRDAAAVVGHMVVAGTDAGVRAAIQTAHGGATLAGSAPLRRARTLVPQNGLGFLYLDFKQVLPGIGAASGSPQAAAVLQALDGAGIGTIAASLGVAKDLLRVQAAAVLDKAPTPHGSGADAVAALPADAWLGLGVGDLGDLLGGLLQRLTGGGGIGAAGVNALLDSFRQQSGIDVRRDVIAWMGRASLFLRGHSIFDLGGALVIQSKDPAATRRVIGKLAAYLRSRHKAPVKPLHAPGVGAGFETSVSSLPLQVALAGNRFVAAIGGGALGEALHPGAPLSGTAGYADAVRMLGGTRPSLYLDAQRLGSALGLLSLARPQLAKLEPLLSHFGVIAAGGHVDGRIARGTIVARVR